MVKLTVIVKIYLCNQPGETPGDGKSVMRLRSSVDTFQVEAG